MHMYEWKYFISSSLFRYDTDKHTYTYMYKWKRNLRREYGPIITIRSIFVTKMFYVSVLATE